MPVPPSDPSSPQTLLTVVVSNYDIPAPLACVRHSSGLNDIYLVETAGDPFVLKLYRAGWRTRTDVLREVEVLLHLDRRGVAAALPVARRDGAFSQTLFLPEGEREAVLFTFAKGKPVDPLDEPSCLHLGRALAAVHNATDGFAGGPARLDLEALLEKPLRALEPLLEDRSDDREFLRGLARRVQERLAALPAGALDRGFCHGDYRPANARLDDETGAVTLFDFECSGPGFRAYDLAYFLTNVDRTGLQLLWRAPAYENDEQLWEAFLLGYAGERPLSHADRAAIPLFVAMRPIWSLGTLLQTLHKNWDLEAWQRTPERLLPIPGFLDQVLAFLREWDRAHL